MTSNLDYKSMHHLSSLPGIWRYLVHLLKSSTVPSAPFPAIDQRLYTFESRQVISHKIIGSEETEDFMYEPTSNTMLDRVTPFDQLIAAK